VLIAGAGNALGVLLAAGLPNERAVAEPPAAEPAAAA
jgi:hypothetical protein